VKVYLQIENRNPPKAVFSTLNDRQRVTPFGTSRLVPATIIARVAKAPVIFLSVGRETAKVSGLRIRLQVTSQSFPSTTTFTNFGFFRVFSYCGDTPFTTPLHLRICSPKIKTQ
jgi:hypothetical protein